VFWFHGLTSEATIYRLLRRLKKKVKMQKINSWNAFGGIIIIAGETGAFPRVPVASLPAPGAIGI
jgi:hypothetical protein